MIFKASIWFHYYCNSNLFCEYYIQIKTYFLRKNILSKFIRINVSVFCLENRIIQISFDVHHVIVHFQTLSKPPRCDSPKIETTHGWQHQKTFCNFHYIFSINRSHFLLIKNATN